MGASFHSSKKVFLKTTGDNFVLHEQRLDQEADENDTLGA